MVAGVFLVVARQQGATRLGCLFSLLILSTVGYYVVDNGSVFLDRWRLVEEMKAQAGFAPSIDDAAIQRRLLRKIEDLDLPNSARTNLRIRRTMRPREITISTKYPVTFLLPFVVRSDTLTVEVTEPI